MNVINYSIIGLIKSTDKARNMFKGKMKVVQVILKKRAKRKINILN